MENDGIPTHTVNGNVTVRFILGLVLGDNLGLNSLLGFRKSFSSSFFCRFCKSPKKLTYRMKKEEKLYLRNVENYKYDIENHNLSDSGIFENSIFNNLKSFNVVHNYAVDMMHDLFEGVCHYDICHILKFYTQTKKIFSLETLNLRKKNFNYGLLEIGNFSQPILERHLNQNRLKMTASEMKSFIRLFPLIIGDLISEDDCVWHFFKVLLKIIELLLKNSFTIGDISLLRDLIYEHNEKYVFLFGDILKPKHHLLIHYPTVIEYSGPPRLYWCFRFEAKHKEVKAYAKVTTSRKNILLSLAKKCQYKFAHFLMTTENRGVLFKECHVIESKYSNFIFSKLKIEHQKVIALTEITYIGTKFQKGNLLTKFNESLSAFEIKELFFLSETSEIIILVNELLINSYISHYDAYEISSPKTIICENLVFNIKDFQVKPINIHHTVTGKLLIRLKQYF